MEVQAYEGVQKCASFLGHPVSLWPAQRFRNSATNNKTPTMVIPNKVGTYSIQCWVN